LLIRHSKYSAIVKNTLLQTAFSKKNKKTFGNWRFSLYFTKFNFANSG